ncbi:Fungal specific transcription factor [Rasamsonia emersonii CBS 393.64]|uniref:Fungal specific transcription factor n=1 Tax=Rasamsonia emersonii (strain ATCC 16479 / CBS 393.64 / IMI 116815) TaxID=1408163 RepID=A0A0F4YEB1_RASE3|nr:Fungal specific transcription factor [Rasamsonia emersonii CBS 393.64]KKA16524.1 Fungal specific transcription factor [Rasamsonia emersonii CBS 393.64]
MSQLHCTVHPYLDSFFNRARADIDPFEQSRKELCHYSYAKPPRKRKQPSDEADENEGSHGLSSETVAKWQATPSTRDGDRTPCSTTVVIGQELSSSNGHLGSVSHGEAECRMSFSGGNGNRCVGEKTASSEQSLSPKLYVDLLLADRQTPAKRRDENAPSKLTEFFGMDKTLFTQQQRHLSILISFRTKFEHFILFCQQGAFPQQQAWAHKAEPAYGDDWLSSEFKAYFEQVHPVYPFLDRASFEQKVFGQAFSPSSVTDPAWSALYHAVLAIGCQYNDGGSFDPGNGQAWSLFEIALSHFQDILMTKGSLTAVQVCPPFPNIHLRQKTLTDASWQALTAMVGSPDCRLWKTQAETDSQAIFSTTVSAWQFESLMISEAAKMAQNNGYNKATGPNDSICHRTFWVLYTLEKISCFTTGRTSVLMDSDIGCPIPYVPESVFGDYDWFLASARYARLVSKIYSSLFSVSSAGKTTGFYHTSICQLRDELEEWRMSIPERYRPGEPLRARSLPGMLAVSIALTTQYLYFNALLTLLRTSLQVGADELGTAHQLATKKFLMKTACSILELTTYIEVATYTSLWVLALMPLSALFIIFDLVVHNPTHPETNNNLALLDVASGHFSRVEYESRGTLPGSLVAEFAHIAREYVRDVQLGERGRNNDSNHQPGNGTTSSKSNTGVNDAPNQAQFPSPVLSQTQSQSQGQLPNNVSSAAVASQTATTRQAPVSLMTSLQQCAYHQTFGGSQPQQAQQYSSSGTLMNANDGTGTESLFFPLVDDPSYMPEEELQLLGIDVMDLFDAVNPAVVGGS